MESYRLYFFDDQSGHITNFRELEAEHDAAAIDRAERWWWGAPMELWHHSTKVKDWPAPPKPSQKRSA